MNCTRPQIFRALELRLWPNSISHTVSVPRVQRWRPLNRFAFRSAQQCRFRSNPADDPNFTSIADQPSVIVKTGWKHGPGLIILGLIPLTAFALGVWQIQRLKWKTDLLARYEDRLVRDPLPLPPQVDLSAISAFDYRRITATGRFRHEQEMLIGPRIHDGDDGYLVVTPLDRPEGASTVLVCRGWIPKRFKLQTSREEGLPRGEVTIEGLLRAAPKKNMFTPDNAPGKGEFYFPDVVQMAALSGSEPIWVEETMEIELIEGARREGKGIPIGRPPAVHLNNNHAQYIFTWFALGIVTSVMFAMVVKGKPKRVNIRKSSEW